MLQFIRSADHFTNSCNGTLLWNAGKATDSGMKTRLHSVANTPDVAVSTRNAGSFGDKHERCAADHIDTSILTSPGDCNFARCADLTACFGIYPCNDKHNKEPAESWEARKWTKSHDIENNQNYEHFSMFL